MVNGHTPKHVAIIMDGNGRWAGNQNLPKHKGHEAGKIALRNSAKLFALKTEVKYLTVFAFATANNKREKSEKIKLNKLVIFYAQQVAEFLEYGCRVRFVGNRQDGKVPVEVLTAMSALEKATTHCNNFFLQIAWNYSGHDEIKRAQEIGFDISKLYNTMLDAQDVPAIDVMIRTGVENPISLNFRDSDFFPLLSSHTVKVPLECLWPDFGSHEIQKTFQNWRSEAHLCGASRT